MCKSLQPANYDRVSFVEIEKMLTTMWTEVTKGICKWNQISGVFTKKS